MVTDTAALAQSTKQIPALTRIRLVKECSAQAGLHKHKIITYSECYYSNDKVVMVALFLPRSSDILFTKPLLHLTD
jgi:hypothetical protein